VFAIQAGSLVVLVPALAAGAALGGLQGLAFAQALVCGCILLPLCLWQLANAGISVRAVSSVVWVPALASLAVGALSLGLVSWLPVPWLELPAGALLAASTAAALLYWRRDDLKLLKEVGREARSEVGELVP
jgi:PST family polysaccharide transporter